MVIGDLIRKDGYKRSVFTETVASGALYIAFNKDAAISGCQTFELFCDLGAAVGKTSGAAANTNGFHLLALLPVRFDHARELFHCHLAVVCIIYDHDRSQGTRTKAVHQLKTEETVFCGFTIGDAQNTGYTFYKCHRTTDMAGSAITKLDYMLSLRLERECLIESRHRIERGERNTQIICQCLESFSRDILEFMLQILHDGQAVVLVGRITLQYLFYFIYINRQLFVPAFLFSPLLQQGIQVWYRCL